MEGNSRLKLAYIFSLEKKPLFISLSISFLKEKCMLIYPIQKELQAF